jgi:hypothetical protein
MAGQGRLVLMAPNPKDALVSLFKFMQKLSQALFLPKEAHVSVVAMPGILHLSLQEKFQQNTAKGLVRTG